MRVTTLTKVGEGMYRPEKWSEPQELKKLVTSKDMLSNPAKFKVLMRACDGTYHKVHNPVDKIIKKESQAISLGAGLNSIASAIYGTENNNTIQRFLLYEDGKLALLLGEVASALHILSSS